MWQRRPQDSDGIKEMRVEVQLVGLSRTLDGLGGPDALIADAARTCYQTNDKATPERDAVLIRRCISGGHYSVLEHANATFRIRGGSRAMTHQLVRHRHMAISQESQRYCDEGNFGYVIPDGVREAGDEAIWAYDRALHDMRTTYLRLQQLGVKNEDARFVLPNAVQSEIVITPNFAELRWIFMKRLTSHAQWEIRKVCEHMLNVIQPQTICFDDIFGYYCTHDSLDDFNWTPS